MHRQADHPLGDLPGQLGFVVQRLRALGHVLEIELVKPHPVELPAEAPLQLRVFGSRGPAFLVERHENVARLVGVGDVPVVESEVILQQLQLKQLRQRR